LKKIILSLLMVLHIFADSLNTQMIKNIKPVKGDNFSFAVFGDNRDGNDILKDIIRLINLDKDIKFAVNNGDLVADGYPSEFKKYIKIIKASPKSIISVIGNHEIPWYGDENSYERVFGKPYFSFRVADSYFIVLDDSDKKGVFKEQYKWLKNELKKSQKFQHRFIFMHVPLYDPRYGRYEKGHSLKSKKNAKKLNKLFDKYRVTMLFCSHIHSYFQGFWHKTPFIITGGAGAPLKKGGFWHYIKVTINGKSVKYDIVKTDMR